MKSAGVDQISKKKFKLLGIDGPWKGTLGNLPAGFQCIIYGNSGNGKTEFCLQLAKYLTAFGKVAWLSYEQGHGYDLQRAVERNKMAEVSGKIVFIDPLAKRKPGVSIFEDLANYLKKRNGPAFVFLDSLDYMRLTFDEYDSLKRRFPRTAMIWISHAEGKLPKSKTGREIEYDGGMGIYVRKFIATVSKNRFSGFDDYIIWEERASLLNPVYFQARQIEEPAPQKTKRPKKPAAQTELADASNDDL